MKINGLDINTEAIGQGLFNLIEDQGDTHILAFGMLPAPLMELVSKQMKQKVLDIVYEQNGITEPLKEFLPIDHKALDKLVADVMREVASAVYKAAAKANVMIV